MPLGWERPCPFSRRVGVSRAESRRVPPAPRGRVPGSAPAIRSLGLFGAAGPSRSLPSRTFGVWGESILAFPSKSARERAPSPRCLRVAPSRKAWSAPAAQLKDRR